MQQIRWVLPVLSLAASAALAEIQVARPESDAANYRNDAVRFDVDLTVKKLRLGDDPVPKLACVPKGAKLYGLGKVLVNNTQPGKAPEERALFQVRSLGEAPQGGVKQPGGCDAASTDDKDKPVAMGEVVALAPGTLDTHHERRGWTYGALAVPYKYQLRGNREQAGAAALGGYIGGRFWWSGVSNQLIGFVGLTKVDVPTIKDGKPTTDQIAGVSYGVGMLTTIKGTFQAGIVLGLDHVSKSAGYAYNDKPWISVSFGHTFTN